jgi:hypothetical protein
MRVRLAAIAEREPLSSERFQATPEFRRFKTIMRKLLKVPKVELDARVKLAKEQSPRAGNPNAPGRKKASRQTTAEGL